MEWQGRFYDLHKILIIIENIRWVYQCLNEFGVTAKGQRCSTWIWFWMPRNSAEGWQILQIDIKYISQPNVYAKLTSIQSIEGNEKTDLEK